MNPSAFTTVTARVANIEFKDVGNGFWKMSLPHSQSWKDKSGEWQEKTFWYNCTVWQDYLKNKCAKIGPGDIVTVTGVMESNDHDGKVYTNLKLDSITIVVKADQIVKREKRAAQVDEEDLPF